MERLGGILNVQLDKMVSPPDPSAESSLSTGQPSEGQEGRDARYSFSCLGCGWETDSEPQLRCHRTSAHGFRSAIALDKPECPHCRRRFSSTISEEMITVLTRYRPIVLELI